MRKSLIAAVGAVSARVRPQPGSWQWHRAQAQRKEAMSKSAIGANGPLPDEGREPMKTVLATAGLLSVAVLTACGGFSGHSESYNKGYEGATTDTQTASIQASFMGIDGLCHAFATQQAAGLNPQEWTQGCEDGLTKVLSTTTGGN